jgi:hypothetical protein
MRASTVFWDVTSHIYGGSYCPHFQSLFYPVDGSRYFLLNCHTLYCARNLPTFRWRLQSSLSGFFLPQRRGRQTVKTLLVQVEGNKFKFGKLLSKIPRCVCTHCMLKAFTMRHQAGRCQGCHRWKRMCNYFVNARSEQTFR